MPLLITSGLASPPPHRWNIGVVIAAPMEHRCRCDPAAPPTTVDMQPFGCLLSTRSQTAAYFSPIWEARAVSRSTTAVDEVFRALADPSRRRLLDSLNGRNGQSLRELCAGLDMARQSVSKHLAILEHANLVTTVRHGREKSHYLNAAPITEIAERWINHYDQQRIAALSDLKRALEAPTMDKPQTDKPDFVYTTYIKTTPER